LPCRSKTDQLLSSLLPQLYQGDQIASLYSLLTFADRPLPATSPAALSANEQKAFRSVKDLLRSVQEHDLGRKSSSSSGLRRKE
jgi:hypothetical protein